MTPTEPTTERHAFVGDDPGGPCEREMEEHDGLVQLCGMPAANIVHAITHTETAPGTELAPADRLVAALAPDNIPDFDDGEAETVLAALTIEDLDGATWSARRLRRAQQRVLELAAIAADQHTRINDWLTGETAALTRDIAFFEGRLHGFHEFALRADPKHAKTINLPDGTALASQAGKLAVEVTDVGALIEYAETVGIAELILDYPEPKPKRVEISKRFASKAEGEFEPGEYAAFDRETGEEVPGVSIVRKPRSFSIRPPAGDNQ